MHPNRHEGGAGAPGAALPAFQRIRPMLRKFLQVAIAAFPLIIMIDVWRVTA